MDKTPEVPPTSKRPWIPYVVVIALLAWYFISAVSATATKCVTFDELFHLTAGYSYWKFGDFRIQPENGNLPQRWAAMPLLFSETHFPDLDQSAWRTSSMSPLGDAFFYGVGNEPDAMLLRARAMMALSGVALGAIVFFYTRSVLGVGPALLSLALYAFCPTVLANGALVTSDMMAALLFAASMLCIWRVLHRVNWKTLLIGSLAMAGLFVAKFAAFLIVPMGLTLVAIQLMSRQPTEVSLAGKTWQVEHRCWRLLVHLATIAVHALVVWIVIWAFYNFRYEMFAATKLEANVAGEMVVVDRQLIPWSVLIKESGTVDGILARMREEHFLPEAYIYGLAHTWQFAQLRSAFLNGEHRLTGWPQFFPYCLLVKTPLPLFVLLGLAAVWMIRFWYLAGETWAARRAAICESLYRTAPMWTLFFVYWAVAITSHLNIGHRHILPTYPPMLMFAGASCLWLCKRSDTDGSSAVSNEGRRPWLLPKWLVDRRWPAQTIVVLVSLGLFAGESLYRWPNYLAYFNQLVGGPSHAYRHLVDSSLDWGQDLPALKQWLDREGLTDSPTEKIYLSYFGSASPAYYGIKASLLPCVGRPIQNKLPEPLEPGTYCISATMLQNVYSICAGKWTHDYEDHYQKLAANVRYFTASNREGREQLLATAGQTWATIFNHYEQARLARLTSFLRQRDPDTEINFSILIYRLSASDLTRALEGPLAELQVSPEANKKAL